MTVSQVSTLNSSTEIVMTSKLISFTNFRDFPSHIQSDHQNLHFHVTEASQRNKFGNVRQKTFTLIRLEKPVIHAKTFHEHCSRYELDSECKTRRMSV